MLRCENLRSRSTLVLLKRQSKMYKIKSIKSFIRLTHI
ncbi:hypothetical protein FTV88_0121 [Heliorestis convoluta]|uniref:Uncharacterized protein n=1 Tax=Heliorestis convoluta TaxID=356322 RepID=A0A5Q2N1R6_9FIRM|nr:hypothetical protein FTV88_0121 [Heliorestis convoluta]